MVFIIQVRNWDVKRPLHQWQFHRLRTKETLKHEASLKLMHAIKHVKSGICDKKKKKPLKVYVKTPGDYVMR